MGEALPLVDGKIDYYSMLKDRMISRQRIHRIPEDFK
jgi:hypothetical protein